MLENNYTYIYARPQIVFYEQGLFLNAVPAVNCAVSQTISLPNKSRAVTEDWLPVEYDLNETYFSAIWKTVNKPNITTNRTWQSTQKGRESALMTNLHKIFIVMILASTNKTIVLRELIH